MASEASLLVLSGVRCFDPARELDEIVDVVVEGGIITRLGRGAATSELRGAAGARVVEGHGLLALPAFVDLHA
ncbi:MAG TPA: dihydroorotase, partial [Polyangiaceae bacterium]|nr:dihydroorotase [Polyangiaceae bacterium]